MQKVILRKKSQRSSNNKSSPQPLRCPQNQLAANVAVGLFPVDVDGDGIGMGIGVAVVSVVRENAVEEHSQTNPSPSCLKCLPKSVLFYHGNVFAKALIMDLLFLCVHYK
ncbi:hypothetical protein PTKIN_Ptkin17bG0147500 [Pterospermum kingtungense]